MAKIIKLPFNSTGRFDLKAVRKKSKTDPPGQLNIFEKAKEDNSKVVSINKNIGNFEAALLSHDTNPDQASDLYRKAIEREDHIPDSYCNLGILQSQQERESAAIDCFTRALESDPRHYEAHFNLANIYADAGNLKLAKLHYEIASEVNAEDPNLFYNLAIVLASLELYEKALQTLQQYARLTNFHSDPEAEKLMILLENSAGHRSKQK